MTEFPERETGSAEGEVRAREGEMGDREGVTARALLCGQQALQGGDASSELLAEPRGGQVGAAQGRLQLGALLLGSGGVG